MKLSDYVFKFFVERGIDHVFMIVGGANSHLADSVSKTSGLTFVCTQNEQAAAMAAEGCARASGKPGLVLVTSGPGGTNAITGVAGAWCDSIPLIFISGQLPYNLTTDGRTVRQLGVQQINIIDIVKPITKYAVMITDPRWVRYYLEEAFFRATQGRPGPVWIDIPTDIQRADIEPEMLLSFPQDLFKKEDGTLEKLPEVVNMLRKAQRPVLIAGHGIRLAGAQVEFLKLVERLGFPVVATWNGIDLIDHRHPLYLGSAGVMGQRGVNFAVANADLILSIGSRLDTRQVGNSPETYSKKSKKIVVDIDENELKKALITIDVPIVSDAGIFIRALMQSLTVTMPDIDAWRRQCILWKQKYPVVLPEYFENNNRVNSYIFIKALCEQLLPDDIVVTDMGTSLTCTMQTFEVKDDQRLFTNTGFASMGFGLPAAIGAWFGQARPRRIVGIFGDGGFQMNIQELQTVVHHKIPIKIFILNNESYLTIKHTQNTFFEGRLVGSSPDTGYSAPHFSGVAQAYGIHSCRIDSQDGLSEAISSVMSSDGPILCEIMMPSDQPLIPISMLDRTRGYAGSPVEVMYPFLSDTEQKENMLD